MQDNFKYTISLIELYYREQWTEKGFVFNIIGFVFDLIVLGLNIVRYISFYNTFCVETIYVYNIKIIIPTILAGRNHRHSNKTREEHPDVYLVQVAH